MRLVWKTHFPSVECHKLSETQKFLRSYVTLPSAKQEIPGLSCNPKVHYHGNKGLSLFPDLSQSNAVHTVTLYLRSILILFSHLRLKSVVCLIISGM
jgi:hypothetical protein